MMHLFIPILDLASCIFFFFWFLRIWHTWKRKSGSESQLSQDCWLAVALTLRAILHQSPKTVCFHLCMNVRSFRAGLLERLWGNPVSQFWHLISIKHKKWYICGNVSNQILVWVVTLLHLDEMFFSGHGQHMCTFFVLIFCEIRTHTIKVYIGRRIITTLVHYPHTRRWYKFVKILQ